jgi:hypothetical protein
MLQILIKGYKSECFDKLPEHLKEASLADFVEDIIRFSQQSGYEFDKSFSFVGLNRKTMKDKQNAN